jgi:transcription-repair coupling factor (superfamily II helicase)
MLSGAAFLPDEYVPDDAQKLHLYRRLSRSEGRGVAALHAEVRDRYGPLPPEVERLFAATRLRIAGHRLGVERISGQRADARVNFRAGTSPRIAAMQAPLRDRQVGLEVRRLRAVLLRAALVRRSRHRGHTGNGARPWQLASGVARGPPRRRNRRRRRGVP